MNTRVTSLSGSSRKRVGVILSGQPTDGGKFQYALTVLRSLEAGDPAHWDLAAFLVGQPGWRERLDFARWEIFDVQKSIPDRIVRRAILALPGGLCLWRRVSMRLDPLGRKLAAFRPDLVIYLNNERFAYELSSPSVMPVHDLMHRYESRFPEVGDAREVRFRERHYHALARYCRAFLVDSAVGKAHLAESYGVAPPRIYVLPFVAPTHLLPLIHASENAVVRALPERFMFYPAQFWKHKNHEGLVRAVALLRGKGVVVPLVFCGSGKNSRIETQALIAELGLIGQITIIDYVSDADLVALYRKAAALVMPTFFGPTNIPPLEAHMLGCPVVISGTYGMPEQLGDAAEYFDPASPQSIANAIERVWCSTSRASELVERGRERHAGWNASHHAMRLASILAELLEID